MWASHDDLWEPFLYRVMHRRARSQPGCGIRNHAVGGRIQDASADTADVSPQHEICHGSRSEGRMLTFTSLPFSSFKDTMTYGVWRSSALFGFSERSRWTDKILFHRRSGERVCLAVVSGVLCDGRVPEKEISVPASRQLLRTCFRRPVPHQATRSQDRAVPEVYPGRPHSGSANRLSACRPLTRRPSSGRCAMRDCRRRAATPPPLPSIPRYIRSIRKGGDGVRYILDAPAVAAFIAALVAAGGGDHGRAPPRHPGGAGVLPHDVLGLCLGAHLRPRVRGDGTWRRRSSFAVAGYAGSANVAPLFLLFALRYRKHSWRPTWWQMALLWLIPAATLALAATNRWHGLIWTGFTSGPMLGSNILIFGHGPWFYVAVAYYAVLGVLAAITLGRAAWRAQRMFVRQTVILLVGPARSLDLLRALRPADQPLPGPGPAAHRLCHHRDPGHDGHEAIPAPRCRARGASFPGGEHGGRSPGPGCVGPGGGREPGGARAHGQPAEVIGRRVDEVPGPLGAAIAGLREHAADHVEMSLPGDPARYIDLHLSPLLDRDGSTSGRVLVIHDLSERRRPGAGSGGAHHRAAGRPLATSRPCAACSPSARRARRSATTRAPGAGWKDTSWITRTPSSPTTSAPTACASSTPTS